MKRKLIAIAFVLIICVLAFALVACNGISNDTASTDQNSAETPSEEGANQGSNQSEEGGNQGSNQGGEEGNETTDEGTRPEDESTVTPAYMLADIAEARDLTGNFTFEMYQNGTLSQTVKSTSAGQYIVTNMPGGGNAEYYLVKVDGEYYMYFSQNGSWSATKFDSVNYYYLSDLYPLFLPSNYRLTDGSLVYVGESVPGVDSCRITFLAESVQLDVVSGGTQVKLVLTAIGTTTLTIPTLPAPEEEPIVETPDPDEGSIYSLADIAEVMDPSGNFTVAWYDDQGNTLVSLKSMEKGQWVHITTEGYDLEKYIVFKNNLYYSYTFYNGAWTETGSRETSYFDGGYAALFDPTSYVKEGDHYRYVNTDVSTIQATISFQAEAFTLVDETSGQYIVVTDLGETEVEFPEGLLPKEVVPYTPDERVYSFDGVSRVDADGNEDAEGAYLLFGTYPQSEVTDATLTAALNEKAGDVMPPYEGHHWKDYGYYYSSQTHSYMWYIDLSYEGEMYRGVYFIAYRPNTTGTESNENKSKQDDSGYFTGYTYWFKYEPIKWQILSEENGEALILCVNIIDAQAFQDVLKNDSYNGTYGVPDYTFGNNYAYSTIRAWLNETFYDTAFSPMQKELILLTTVDNSIKSAATNGQTTPPANKYACEDTEDYVFLISRNDATNPDYGFNGRDSATDAARRKQGTRYAQAQGLSWSSSGTYTATGNWWYRSPALDYYSGNTAAIGRPDGSMNIFAVVDNTCNGVVPALRIRLAENAEE